MMELCAGRHPVEGAIFATGETVGKPLALRYSVGLAFGATSFADDRGTGKADLQRGTLR